MGGDTGQMSSGKTVQRLMTYGMPSLAFVFTSFLPAVSLIPCNVLLELVNNQERIQELVLGSRNGKDTRQEGKNRQ